MLKDDLIRIRHMLDAAKEAKSFIKDKKRSDLDTDRMLVLSLVKSIEIMFLSNMVKCKSPKGHLEVAICDLKMKQPAGLIRSLQNAQWRSDGSC